MNDGTPLEMQQSTDRAVTSSATQVVEGRLVKSHHVGCSLLVNAANIERICLHLLLVLLVLFYSCYQPNNKLTTFGK